MAELDWGRARKVTLWTYEEPIGTLQSVMAWCRA